MRPAFHLAASLLAATLLAGTPRGADAGPAAQRAAARVESIAAGDLAGTLARYTERSTLAWVGGPLDSSAEVWGRFAKAQGPLEVTVGEAGHDANPRGATAVAAAALRGASGEVKVRHVSVWRDGTVTNEVWQVDPSLAV